MKNRIGHIILLTYLPLIVLFQFGQSSFVHFHITEEGKVVSHSHPYQIPSEEDGTSNPGHNHSNSELIVLGSIDGAFNESPDPLVLDGILINVVKNDNLVREYLARPKHIFKSHFFRGPPCA